MRYIQFVDLRACDTPQMSIKYVITLRIGPFQTVIHISLSTLADDILLRRSEQITLSSNNTHSLGTRALRLAISTVQLLVCLSSNLTSSNLVRGQLFNFYIIIIIILLIIKYGYEEPTKK